MMEFDYLSPKYEDNKAELSNNLKTTMIMYSGNCLQQ